MGDYGKMFLKGNSGILKSCFVLNTVQYVHFPQKKFERRRICALWTVSLNSNIEDKRPSLRFIMVIGIQA